MGRVEKSCTNQNAAPAAVHDAEKKPAKISAGAARWYKEHALGFTRPDGRKNQHESAYQPCTGLEDGCILPPGVGVSDAVSTRRTGLLSRRRCPHGES